MKQGWVGSLIYTGRERSPLHLLRILDHLKLPAEGRQCRKHGPQASFDKRNQLGVFPVKTSQTTGLDYSDRRTQAPLLGKRQYNIRSVDTVRLLNKRPIPGIRKPWELVNRVALGSPNMEALGGHG